MKENRCSHCENANKSQSNQSSTWQEQIWRDIIFPGYERMLRAPRGLPRLTRDRIQTLKKKKTQPKTKKTLFAVATVKTSDFPGQV